MIAVDTNILVYAQRTDSPFHAKAARCVTEVSEGSDTWAIPWSCMHEALGVLTHPRIYVPPTTVDAAIGFAEQLLKSPNLLLLAESDSHWSTLRSLIISGGIVGPRVHDARIAAICLQHGVREFWSADRDFSRFPALKIVNPLLP